MKILDYKWFNQGGPVPSTLGVVKVERVIGERKELKYYLGADPYSHTNSEEMSLDYIINWGCKITQEQGEALLGQ